MSDQDSRVVVTIGVFDGVHAGHRQVLAIGRRIANELDVTFVAATFDPPPKQFFNLENYRGLLTLPSRRAKLLSDNGADQVKILKFDKQMSEMAPESFIKDIIVGEIAAKVVVVGSNFRFGKESAGSIETLRDFSTKYDFEVHVVELVGDTQTWSSTRIRTALVNGEVTHAAEMLGRPHRITGEVVHGDHRGRELGYPTANLDIEGDLLIPQDGVYAGLLTIDGEVHPTAVSIGTNPTFEGVIGRRVEAYVLDKAGLDLYGKTADLDFLAHIRGMAAFNSIDDLLIAMNSDVTKAREITSNYLNSH
ncbi:MAG: bifunctional riboflavin kinase/FAD synthetase [Actinomycetes bacterium]